ncbi:MAG: glutaredoxin 3 [Desulfuromonas sp.]|uniref:glutaredoxin 3 n=1 Tax=Desulfuromonas sp. TaxID=892 RepID=UPI000CAAC426|nr:glutaredoxin 3 [Desulfuromonas sp.]PLX84267.1 MAG: glutaredoxin 3 [Desulfuromonas sp.]
MKKIEVYTKSYCPYCARALELLQIKGVDYSLYDVSADPAKELEMQERSGQETVPEIFVEGTLLGGCAELFWMDEKGELDRLLGLRAGCCE